MGMKVGIDLGTTYSAVSRYDPASGKPVIIPNGINKDTTPSVICFYGDEILVGDEAKDMQKNGCGIIASNFKSSIADPVSGITVGDRTYTASDLSTILLKKLIEDAEAATGEKVDEAVITVPAYFNDTRRTATMKAGEACGITVSNVINEPTAAAIYYGYKTANNKTLMVYDLGGGTFDVTIIRVQDGVISVLGTDGDHGLGGKNWDEKIMNYICEQFMDEFGENLKENPQKRYELEVACEKHKKTLSITDNVVMPVTYNGYNSSYDMSREMFENRTRHLLETTGETCIKLLETLKLRWTDIDEILLVGGSTRMPSIPRYLREISGREVRSHSDTDLAVAKGAGITAALYTSKNQGLTIRKIEDVTSHSLGVLSTNAEGDRYINEIMIRKNTRLPHTVHRQFSLMEGNTCNKIEMYTLEGESRDPTMCNPLSKVVITGFVNNGRGVLVDVDYSYDRNGVVKVEAYQDGEPLDVDPRPVEDDLSWMNGDPRDRTGDAVILKNIAICVDLSRSMRDAPLANAKRSIHDFVSTVSGEGVRFTLIGFGDKGVVAKELTDNVEDFKVALEGLKVNMVGRGTDFSPIELAHAQLKDQPGMPIIVILTDGIWGKKDKAVEQSRACRQDGTSIHAIGFGESDLGFLRQIATVEAGAIYTTIDRMGSAFNSIATAIKKNETGLMCRPQMVDGPKKD